MKVQGWGCVPAGAVLAARTAMSIICRGTSWSLKMRTLRARLRNV